MLGRQCTAVDHQRAGPEVPEGHTIHRAARRHAELLAGQQVHAESPQGRFADGAAALDGHQLVRVDAHGKHLFYRFDDDLLLHVHLGLFGRFNVYTADPPEPRGALRLRMQAGDATVDLRGPTACELGRVITRLKRPGRSPRARRLSLATCLPVAIPTGDRNTHSS